MHICSKPDSLKPDKQWGPWISFFNPKLVVSYANGELGYILVVTRDDIPHRFWFDCCDVRHISSSHHDVRNVQLRPNEGGLELEVTYHRGRVEHTSFRRRGGQWTGLLLGV